MAMTTTTLINNCNETKKTTKYIIIIISRKLQKICSVKQIIIFGKLIGLSLSYWCTSFLYRNLLNKY